MLIPLLMLGGLAISLALSARPSRGIHPVVTEAAAATQSDRAIRPEAPVALGSHATPREASAPWSPLDPGVPRAAGTLGQRRTSVGPTLSPLEAPLVPSMSDDPGSATAVDEASSCAEGMVLVEGDYYPTLGHVCLKRLEGEVERCAEYAAPAIYDGIPQKKRFCIDRFEYPNLEGVRPVVMVNWHEAQDACEAEGKRLCTTSEWTLACEGAERVPYPYGYARDSSACNIDRPHPEVDADALTQPRAVSSEVARLDQRVPSGQMARCKSPYGVQDMTGNVDEWVLNEKHFGPPPTDGSERPFISALKGGYWGPVRNRCRATTTAHDEWFRYYEVGFRCCSNAG